MASDKAKAPKMAEKLCAIFNCKLFSPEKDLGLLEKAELTKEIKTENSHERDAVAAAIAAYKSICTSLLKIDQTLASLGLESYSERIKTMVISKEAKNIAEAIELLRKDEKPKPKKVQTNWRDRTKELERKLTIQEKNYEILKLCTKRLEKKIEELESQKLARAKEELRKTETIRKRILKEREIAKREIIIRQLKHELEAERAKAGKIELKVEKEQELKQIQSSGKIPVIVVESFNKDEIAKINKEFGLAGAVLYFKNYVPSASTAKFLAALKPDILIFDDLPAEAELLKEFGIKIVIGLRLKFYNFYAAIDQKLLDEAMKEQERKGFLSWLKGYKKGNFINKES